MIYDTFTFFDELELLELRLHELAGVVDKFALVEATKTHSNQPKPLHYAENKKRSSAFHDKIIYIVVDDTPDSQDPWTLLLFQRNCIRRGFVNCRPNDIILVSNIDEIPRATTVARASQELKCDDSVPARLIHTVLKTQPVTKVFRGPLTDPQRLNQLINGGKDIFGRPCEFKFVELDKTYPRVCSGESRQVHGSIKGL